MLGKGKNAASFKNITDLIKNILFDENNAIETKMRKEIIISYEVITAKFETKKLGFFKSLLDVIFGFKKAKATKVEIAKKIIANAKVEVNKAEMNEAKLIHAQKLIKQALIKKSAFEKLQNALEVASKLAKGMNQGGIPMTEKNWVEMIE